MEIQFLKQHPRLLTITLIAILAAACGACFLQVHRFSNDQSSATPTSQVNE